MVAVKNVCLGLMLLAVLLGSPAGAVEVAPSNKESTSGVSPLSLPLEQVQILSRSVFALLQTQKAALETSPSSVFSQVDALVAPLFDVENMARWALGKYWSSATDAQQAAFAQEFRILLVRTYSLALAKYVGGKLYYMPMSGAAGTSKVIVRSFVAVDAGKFASVQYRLHRIDGRWKIYDVLIEGGSLLTPFRKTFVKDVGLTGLDAVVSQMANQNLEQSKK